MFGLEVSRWIEKVNEAISGELLRGL